MTVRHDADGYLPEGMHVVSWADVLEQFGWNPYRRALLDRFRPALVHLAEAGCRAVLLAGSFVTTKAQPGDIDAVWSVEGVDFDLLHAAFKSPDGVRFLKATFGSDMVPSFLIEADSMEPFAEFFQSTRDGRRVGVLIVDLSTLDEEFA